LNQPGEVGGGNKTSIVTERDGGNSVGEGGDGGGLGKSLRAKDGDGG